MEVLRLDSDTNGIVYLNLYFDVSDFDADELRLLNVLTTFFGELRTEHYSADRLQTKIKATLGGLAARVELIPKRGELRECRPYLLVSASMLEENVPAALELLEELFINGRYDETGRISEKTARGRHTTRAVTLFSCDCGGERMFIADTPGFSMLDFINFNFFGLDELVYTFPEFEKYLGGCRYRGCTHTKEEGCAVLAAVAEGAVPKSRHDSYLAIYEELKKVPEWKRKAIESGR